MNVIIAGAGEVGGHAAEVLSAAGHSVTIIDLSAERLRRLNDVLDVRSLVGHCSHIDVLIEAGVERCDLLVAATAIDEVNLLTATLASAMGAAQTIVRVHHTANFSLRNTRYANALGIDDLVCPEHLTALEIARAIRNPGSIALEEFARGKLLMHRVKVAANAKATGMKLSEIELPRSVRVATVEKPSGPVIAEATTTIEEGDYVTIIGKTAVFDAARKLFNKDKEKRLHLVIMGETSTAVWLCRVLKNRVFSVRLFTTNHQRAEELAEKLDHVTVLEADPTDTGVFVEEKIELADVFIAATDDDEHNILACAQAKALGTDKVISVVQRRKYMYLFEHVGIDYAFSPRSVAVKSILQLIETGPVRSVAKFADHTAEVYQVRPANSASAIGQNLRTIKLPPKAMVAAIRRGDDVLVPGAEDEVKQGDTLLVIGPARLSQELSELFLST